LRGHEGGPLVIDDVIYIHSPFPNKVFALDQKDQSIIWQYEPTQNGDETIPVMCCDTVNRGLGYGDGKIYLLQSDTTLVALDAKTGKPVWSVKNGDPKLGMTNTSTPFVVKDKVLVGISGGEFGVRGFMAAYNAKDGSLAWKGYSMGPDKDTLIDPEKTTSMLKPVGKDSSTSTWKGEQWKIGGGTTWGWYAYDPALNLMYYGSGNPSTWNPTQRPGDNKWSMSLWARDVDTGAVKWIYQMTPHDEWDYDGINEVVLVDQEIGGKTRKTIVHFDRNGFGYTLDRVTGELLVAEKFDKAVNWATHVDKTTGRPQVVSQYSTEHNGEDVDTKDVCPAALGSKNQQPSAYSPKTKLFYIPGNHVCMNYEPFEVEYTAGQPYVGATLSMFPAGRNALTGEKDGSTNLGQFTAWDATTGTIKWSNAEPFSVWSGTLATAGDVVFYGTLEGYLKAVDAASGKELYKFKTPSGIIGNVNTWSYNGKQYIGVLSGLGGWAGIGMAAGLKGDTEGLGAVGAYKNLSKFTQLGGVFTVFALPN
ncbi:MAG: PQQ-dependent dehydrogenase, methanol/ethanol family, partial [Methylococcales bacterium]